MLLATQTDFLASCFGHEKTIEILAKAGFDAIDLSLFDMQKPNGAFSGDNALEVAKELRKKAEALGLSFTQAHAPFSFNLKEKPFDEYTPLVCRSIKIAAAAGAKQIIVHPFHHVVFRENERFVFEKNIEYYRSFIPLCEEYGIKVCAENMWQIDSRRGYITEDACSYAEKFAEYLDTIGSEWIIGCLDIGHCGLVGEEPDEAILTLGHNRLKALHVHDNDYKHDSHTIPGCGNINWDKVTAALAKINYSGEFTFEADNFYRNFEPDFLQDAANFLALRGRNLIAKIEKSKAQN